MSLSEHKYSMVVGIFISIALAILLIGVFTLGGQHDTFVKKFPIKAVFDDVNGLKPGDNVWLSGVKIGVIDKIDIEDEGAILITMSIEKKVQPLIHKDSKVKIGSDGLIGNTIIIIYGGTKKSPGVASGDLLFSEKTAGTKDMLGTLDLTSKNLLVITNNLKEISNNILKGRGMLTTLINDSTLPENLKYTVGDLKSTIANFKTTSVQSKKILQNLVDYSSKFNKEGSLPNDIVTDTVVFHHIRTTVAALSSTVSKLNTTMDTITAFSNNIKKASVDIEHTTGALLHDEQAATQLKSMIRNLDSASHNLNEDLEAIKHNFLFRGYFRKKAKAAVH